jgi:hypothetical protein
MSRITVKAKPRGNRNYRNGRRAEYEARALLISEGYAVMRAAGSKGAADLVGVKQLGVSFILDVVWVSVKRGTGRADKAQRERLAALPGRREIWSRQRGGAWVREVI